MKEMTTKNNDCTVSQRLEKLARYEDLEKRGLLLELPCKIGDPVYRVVNVGCKECEYYDGKSKMESWTCSSSMCPPKLIKTKFELHMLNEIGKTVFLAIEDKKAVKQL